MKRGLDLVAAIVVETLSVGLVLWFLSGFFGCSTAYAESPSPSPSPEEIKDPLPELAMPPRIPTTPGALLIAYDKGAGIEIKADGSVRLFGGAKLSDAAKAFWEIVEMRNPISAELAALRSENARLKKACGSKGGK